MSGPNCQSCRHYFVTWDPARPRGCRAHGFKSAEPPAQVVFTSSGMRCQFFEEKPATEAETSASPRGSDPLNSRAADPLNPQDTFVRRR